MRSSIVSMQDVSGIQIGGGLLDLVVDLRVYFLVK